MKECMERAVALRVPLRVKLAVGRTWGSLKPLELEEPASPQPPIARAIFGKEADDREDESTTHTV